MNAPRSAKRKGFPPNLYQKPDGYFYYRNPQSGKTKGIGRDKAEAFREARAANAVLATMSKSSLVAWVSGVEQYTVEKWLDRYIELWTEKKKPAAGTLATAKRYIARIKKADFAWMAVKDVTTQHISDYLNKLERESTASVAMNLRARLHDAFEWAQNQGLTETGKNPVSATLVPDYKVKRERLSLEQFLAIREKVPEWAANAMNLALLTGQRREDIVNMQFSDYKEGSLFVVQGKTGHKLQQDGRIRLSAVGMSIEDAVKQCRDRIVSRYMIHHTRTSGVYKAGEQVSADGLSGVFSAARDACGISAEEGKTPPTFHEIRSLAERLYKKEYGQEFAQAIMGHKHAKMTAEYDDLRGSGWAVVSVK
jgi:integrase